MDKKAVLSVIDRFIKALEVRSINVDRVILYGSYATGTFTDDSDIDLVVVSRDFSSKNYWERIDILSEAIYDVFEPIEAVALTPEEWDKGTSPISDYARQGETVYAA